MGRMKSQTEEKENIMNAVGRKTEIAPEAIECGVKVMYLLESMEAVIVDVDLEGHQEQLIQVKLLEEDVLGYSTQELLEKLKEAYREYKISVEQEIFFSTAVREQGGRYGFEDI